MSSKIARSATSIITQKSTQQARYIPSPRYYASKPILSSAPVPTPRPQFPPAADPFEPPKQSQPTTSTPSSATTSVGEADSTVTPRPIPKHGPWTVWAVMKVARLMGYNSKSVTAIRETRAMCGLVVDGVARDREFWYNECSLPDTYQTFFQLHLLYLLLLIPRLRSLRTVPSTIPNPSTTASIYQTELLQHFFNLAENQMRQTLGAGERERTVSKYMQSFGEQWKGGGLGFDYALAKGNGGVLGVEEQGEDEGDNTSGGDVELAGWVWRNLFSASFSDGSLQAPPSPPGLGQEVDPAMTELDLAIKDLMLASNLQKITMFIRREIGRLERLTDEEVLSGEIGAFGRVEDV